MSSAQPLRNLSERAPFIAVLPTACALDLKEKPMNGVIYLVGLVVVVMFILSLLGLR
jgi:hypothetical protein